MLMYLSIAILYFVILNRFSKTLYGFLINSLHAPVAVVVLKHQTT